MLYNAGKAGGMAGAETTTAAKGLRGLTQDFLPLELRALSERIQGFENLNRERFNNIDRQFENVDRQFVELKASIDRRFEDVDRRFVELNQSIDRRFEDIDRRFVELNQSIDRRFEGVDRRFVELKENIDLRFADVDRRLAGIVKRLDRMDERFERLETTLRAMPEEFARSVDKLVQALDLSRRLEAIEREIPSKALPQ